MMGEMSVRWLVVVGWLQHVALWLLHEKARGLYLRWLVLLHQNARGPSLHWQNANGPSRSAALLLYALGGKTPPGMKV